MGEQGVRKEHKIVNNVELKHCFGCNKWKKTKRFSKNKCYWDGLSSWCRECVSLYAKKNREKRNILNKRWRLANPEKAKISRDKWIKNNPQKWRDIQTKKNKRKRLTLKGKLCDRIATNLYYSLKGNKNGRGWESILGYTYKQLNRHLTKTMPKGYTWDDYMMGKLHIDHKVPVKVFNFNKTDDIDFKKCWALKNLQLLPAIENIKKGAKLTKHFQPSLIFG